MTIRYVDLEAGNDANDGLSFANRKKTISSATTGAAAGDVIRVMGSPAPTSLGQNGTWTSQKLQSTRSIASTTNATPIVVTTSANHGYSNGDTVYIAGHSTNDNANGMWEIANKTNTTFELVGSTGNGAGGADGTVRLRNNSVVRLTSAVTQTITSTVNRGEGRATWTASANVTTSINGADFKCADCSDSFAIAAGFTTGLAAYSATGTLNLSGYEQVSFWIKQTAGTVAVDGDVSLRLCSDNAGAVSVTTIAIPGLVANNRWVPVTVNLGAALPAAVESIALYVDTDRGAQTFRISNVIACKAAASADSLSLTSWIGKNAAGETYWPIQSINGTRVVIDGSSTLLPSTTTWMGYYGASETVTTYKRDVIAPTMVAAAGTAVQTIAASGSSGNVLAIEGGWDRTDMTTQSLETWIDGRNGLGIGFYASTQTYVRISKCAACRFDKGFYISGTGSIGWEGDFVAGNGCATYGIQIDTPNDVPNDQFTAAVACANGTGIQIVSYVTFTGTVMCNCNGSVGVNSTSFFNNFGTVIACGNNGSGVAMAMSGCTVSVVTSSDNGTHGVQLTANAHATKIGTVTANNNQYGISISGDRNRVGSVTANSNSLYPVTFSDAHDNIVFSLASSGNANGPTATRGHNTICNAVMSDTLPPSISGTLTNARLKFHNYGTAGVHRIVLNSGALIDSEAAVRHTASGIAWKLSPASAAYNTADAPVYLPIGRFLVSANVETTISVWMRRTNTGLTGRLMLRGGQVAGVANDVSANMTAGADTWEQVSITFTPTATDVVEVEAQAWGGTTYALYVDDVSIA